MLAGRRGAVLLAFVCLLAGCGAFSDASPAAGGGSSSVTPAPLPTLTSGQGPAQQDLATLLGRGEDGPRQVATIHRRRLANRSYRLRYNRSIHAGGTVLQRINASVWVEPGGDTYRLVRTTSTSPDYDPFRAGDRRLDVYREASVGWVRRVSESGTSYDTLRARRDGPAVDRTRADEVESLLRAFGSPVIEQETSPFQVSYRLRSMHITNTSALALPAGLDSPQEARLTMVVTSQGLVRSYEVTYRARFQDEVVRVDQRVRITGRDRETVSRPDWVAVARARNGTATDDGNASDRDTATGADDSGVETGAERTEGSGSDST